MAIRFKRYVDITSGVAGATRFPRRQLIGRLFTSNTYLPPNSFVEMDSPEEVGDYFGYASAEYARAVFYFKFVSKSITKAKTISFARWVNTAVAPTIFGNKLSKLVATFQAITAGTLQLTLGGTTNTIGPVDLSATNTLAAVATAIQAAINAKSGSMWTAATVSYDATRKSFNFTGGVTGDNDIAVVEGSQNLAAALGWLAGIGASGATLGEGSAVQLADETVAKSAQSSNNFGSFLFMPALTLDEVEDVADWNTAQNVAFQFTVRVIAADADAWYTALKDKGGLELTLAPLASQYPEMAPMILTAATDYDRLNATQNFMFQEFDLEPSVATDEDADYYDARLINYYGVTQTAGAYRAFYQRGLMMGLPTDPVDMNVYANEQWLKDDAAAGLMNLAMALPKISANSQGRSQCLTRLQATVQKALRNGVISVGKELTPEQIAAVAEITGSPKAWFQVQNAGYWLDVVIEPRTNSTTNRTEYVVVYTLVYSKDDVVRKMVGTHVLV